MSLPEPIPLLSPRDGVLFPGDVLRLELRDPGDLAALDAAAAGVGGRRRQGGLVLVVPPLRRDRPGGPPNLAGVGTAARVRSRVRLPRGGERAILHGLFRAAIESVERRDGVLVARAERIAPSDGGDEERALLARTRELVRALARTGSPRLRDGEPGDLPELLALNAGDADRLVDLAATLFELTPDEQAELLTPRDALARLRRLHEVVESERLAAEDARGLDALVRGRRHRAYLREQLAAIRDELGEDDPRDAEARDLRERLDVASLPIAVRDRVERELVHLRAAARGSSEAGRIRNWIDWVLELPWQPRDEPPRPDAREFERVRAALDATHAGLAEVKERVVELLAVRQLRERSPGTSLCFLGPPGTGKSSMARAVARALGRRFVHVPVGGLAEESELRGTSHRYEGGGPGLVLEGLHRAGASDAVVLLDEIDKVELGSGEGTFGGALLEILDAEQSGAFHDEYLGLPYDLSDCVIVATANDLSHLPEALVDRLEVIDFHGYTESEKLAIARAHLLPAARAAAGLARHQLRISPAALEHAVRHYTEEAGVRQLGRVLAALARKAAVSVVRSSAGLSVRKADLPALLGPAVADEDLRLRRPAVGIAAGLAWTSAGGALLPVEALAMPGSGRTQLTGQIGEIMRESVLTALSWVRTLFDELGLGHDELERLDLHIHFPAAAVPKDGPSAGVPIALAILSLLTRTPLRHDVGLTGELSLRGQVLPVGGLREKLLAALRAGLSEVVLPARNAEEVERLPPDIRRNLTLHLIEHVRDAFGIALARGGRLGRPVVRAGRRSRAARRARRGRGPDAGG